MLAPDGRMRSGAVHFFLKQIIFFWFKPIFRITFIHFPGAGSLS
jgi:hypothetical protein